MKKFLLLGVMLITSLAYSQNQPKAEDDYILKINFPKSGYRDYIYEKDYSDNDYQIVAGPTIENQPIRMQLEVKDDRAKLFMYIKNNGDPTTSLSFSNAKFKLHQSQVSYVIKESGNSTNLIDRWFQIDDDLIEMLDHSKEKGCEISYEFEKNSYKSTIDKENLESIYQMIAILRALEGV